MCQVVQTTEDALTTRVLQSTIHALELFGIYLGTELGLYEALKSGRRLTPPELATPPASPPATHASGSSSRRSRDSCAWNRPPRRRIHGGIGSRPSTSTSWPPRTILSHLRPDGADGRRHRRGARTRRRRLSEWRGRGVSTLRRGVSRGSGRHQSADVFVGSGDALDSRAARPPRRTDVDARCVWRTSGAAPAGPRSRWREHSRKADVVGFDADPASVHDAQRNAAAHGVAVRFDVRAADAVTEDRPVRSRAGAGSAP